MTGQERVTAMRSALTTIEEQLRLLDREHPSGIPAALIFRAQCRADTFADALADLAVSLRDDQRGTR